MLRWDYSKELYAEEWAKWEKKLRETLLSNADYFNSIQVFNIFYILSSCEIIGGFLNFSFKSTCYIC